MDPGKGSRVRLSRPNFFHCRYRDNEEAIRISPTVGKSNTNQAGSGQANPISLRANQLTGKLMRFHNSVKKNSERMDEAAVECICPLFQPGFASQGRFGLA